MKKLYLYITAAILGGACNKNVGKSMEESTYNITYSLNDGLEMQTNEDKVDDTEFAIVKYIHSLPKEMDDENKIKINIEGIEFKKYTLPCAKVKGDSFVFLQKRGDKIIKVYKINNDDKQLLLPNIRNEFKIGNIYGKHPSINKSYSLHEYTIDGKIYCVITMENAHANGYFPAEGIDNVAKNLSTDKLKTLIINFLNNVLESWEYQVTNDVVVVDRTLENMFINNEGKIIHIDFGTLLHITPDISIKVLAEPVLNLVNRLGLLLDFKAGNDIHLDIINALEYAVQYAFDINNFNEIKKKLETANDEEKKVIIINYGKAAIDRIINAVNDVTEDLVNNSNEEWCVSSLRCGCC